jgi:hypothetical protein
LVLAGSCCLENNGADNHFHLPFVSVDSPLCVMLRKLVETDRTEHGPTTSSVSVLSGIFRAIQKAEDPADSGITHVCPSALFYICLLFVL